MELSEIRASAIAPALELLPTAMTSPEAVVMLLAIGLQESRFQHRRQIGGPARGFWQFEDGRLSGLAGLFTLRSTERHMRALCAACRVEFHRTAVYHQLEHDDVLAAGVARLLLWSDPHALPEIGNAQAAWDLYIRTWRPGKPHRDTWDALYAQAVGEVCDCG